MPDERLFWPSAFIGHSKSTMQPRTAKNLFATFSLYYTLFSTRLHTHNYCAKVCKIYLTAVTLGLADREANRFCKARRNGVADLNQLLAFRSFEDEIVGE